MCVICACRVNLVAIDSLKAFALVSHVELFSRLMDDLGFRLAKRR